MRNEFENSDKRLQEKLEGFRMAAPEGAWAGIEQNIGGKSDGRRPFFFLWILLLLIGVSGVGILTFTFWKNNDAKPAAKIASVTPAKSTKTTQKTEANASKKSFEALTQGEVQESNSTVNNKIENSVPTPEGSQSNNTNAGSSSTQKPKMSTSDRTNSTNNSGITQQTNSHSTNTAEKNTTSNSHSNTHLNATANTHSNSNTSSSEENQNGLETASSNSNETNSKSEEHEAHKIEETEQLTTALNPTETADENISDSASKADTSAMSTNVTNPTIADASTPEPTEKPNDEEKVRPLWSLEAGLDLSSMQFNHAVANNSSLQQSLNASYSQNYTQGVFLRANYQPFPQFSFHSGLEFAQNKRTQDYKWLSTAVTYQYDTTGWYFDSITQQQLPIIDTTETISQVENLQQFTSSESQFYIPFGVMFHIGLGQKSELGINATGLVGIRSGSAGEILIDGNGNSILVTEAYKSVNFSARAALRYSYFVGRNTAVYVEPYLGFGLNDRSNASLPFSTRFRNSGIRAGFRYNF